MGEVYFSGGENFCSEKGFYDPRYLFFEKYLKCPICKKTYEPNKVRVNIVKELFEDGTYKNVEYIICPYGCNKYVGTDIRYYIYNNII